MKILCVVPFYNEKKNLIKLIGGLNENSELLNSFFDFIFIDDGSDDGSSNVIKKYKIINNKKNFGYGKTIKIALDYGISHNYNYLSVMPGDYQRNFSDLIKLKNELLRSDPCDLINGSKLHIKNIPFWNKLTNIFFSKYVNLLTNSKDLNDVLSGFRIYNLNSLGDYYSHLPNDYAFDSCFFLNMKKSRKKIINIDVFANYKNQTTKMKFKPFVFFKIFSKLTLFFIKTF